MQADVLEERWSPTTIHATFVLDLPSSTSYRYNISIPLPLPGLGWTFALSLAPAPGQRDGRKPMKLKQPVYKQWSATALSFRQRDHKIPWGNTFMHAQLSCGESGDDGHDNNNIGTIDVKLAHTPSVEVPLATPYTLISSYPPTKVWLIVTIQQCPFAKGLFQARSHHGSEAEAQIELVRQSGDRVLDRSLTTGRNFDVQFLSCSTRSAPGNTGKVLPTYASLSVLEKHVNFPDAALNDDDNANSRLVKEISSLNNDEYELLDSDYEDEDEDSSPADLGAYPPCDRDLVITLEAKSPENSTERSWSPVKPDGASDQDTVDDVNKDRGGPSHLFSGATVDREPPVLVKFAAHRTWHAFLWYCYTGHVEFNKLKSQVQPGVRRLPLAHLMDGPPSCSPKSMYRLAHLVGNDELKAKALGAIKEKMGKANILDETFSIFTSKHPDVREAQLTILMKHIGSPEVKEAFLEKMKKFGDMPHAKPVLLALCDRLAA